MKGQFVRMAIVGAFLAFLIGVVAALPQNPQSATAPIYSVNAKYANGFAPGYWPTQQAVGSQSAATGLDINVGPGTVNCGSGAILTYAGGQFSMTASATNYIYLNTGSSCAPQVKTTAFVGSDIPIAVVVAGSSTLTSIVDDRTSFNVPSSGAGGSSYPVDLTNCGSNSATCNGTTDDHVNIQACIDQNPAVFIPTSNLGTIQCNLGTVGIHTGSAFGFTAIYGNGQFFGYTGTGKAVDMSGGGATLVSNLNLDMTGSSGSAIAFQTGPGSVLIDSEDVNVPSPSGDSIKMIGGRVSVYTGTGLVHIQFGVAEGLDFTDPTTSGLSMTTASNLSNSTICGPAFINGGVGGATAILENDTFCTDNSGDPALTISDRSNVSLTGVTLDLNGSSVVALSLPSSPTLLAVNGNVIITDPSETFIGTATSGLLNVQDVDGSSFVIPYPVARIGTFVCTAGGTITVPNTVATTTSNILISLNAPSGTISTQPVVNSPGNGTSFSVLCGVADTSAYNYYVQ